MKQRHHEIWSEVHAGVATAVGLTLLGLVVGFTTGASRHEGISEALLTSVFAFVGGVLLTFAGFRVRTRKQEDKPEIHPAKAGWGLAAFSIGLLAGLVFGMKVAMNQVPGLQNGVARKWRATAASDGERAPVVRGEGSSASAVSGPGLQCDRPDGRCSDQTHEIPLPPPQRYPRCAEIGEQLRGGYYDLAVVGRGEHAIVDLQAMHHFVCGQPEPEAGGAEP